MRFSFRKGGNDASENRPPRDDDPSGGQTRKSAPTDGQAASRTDALRQGLDLPENEEDLREDASGTRHG